MSQRGSESQWKLSNQNFSSPLSVLLPYPLPSLRISQVRNVAPPLPYFSLVQKAYFLCLGRGHMSRSSLYDVLALATSMARPDPVGHHHPVDAF